MSHAYRAVGWNRQKKLYDLTVLAGVLVYLGAFLGIGFALHTQATAEILLIRALGTLAFLLLHLILSIGPLCRLDSRFLPLLYNRRHLGVTMFLLALAHGGFSLIQFHAFGDLHPLVSVLTSNGRYDSLAWFPFQPLGLIALVLLFLMAATSHDFWLANLTPPVWKSLHMGVYLAYALLVAHVALGSLQVEHHPVLSTLLGLGVAWIVGIHLVAGWRQRADDRAVETRPRRRGGFVEVCGVDDIPEGRARTFCLSGERVAVFRYDDKISALSSVCQHQNGPLGEGRILDGCVTCPWHGFQYDPETGASPPPFEESVPTFHVRAEDGRIWVHPVPELPGTHIEPAGIASPAICPSESGEPEPYSPPREPRPEADSMSPRESGGFYVGYSKTAPAGLSHFVRRLALALVLLAGGTGAILAWLQSPFDPGTFEFGVERRFVGILRRQPFPMLEVDRPRAAGGSGIPERSSYALVELGKHGAMERVEELDGRRVELAGSLIYRGGRTMIELAAAPIGPVSADADEPAGPWAVQDLGNRTLRGEIVDSKCYLGVMKPGRKKTHRACASLCIRGGIPPLFVLTTPAADFTHLFLTDDKGEPLNSRVLDMVAEPIEITGRIARHGDTFVLAADPAGFRRLSRVYPER